MFLTGPEILRRMASGYLSIHPYDPAAVNPNSVNLTLAPTLLVYQDPYPLDLKRNDSTQAITIPEEGFILQPGVLYLGSTVEQTHSPGLVPMVMGRSSVGRKGVFVHVTAGWGDDGFAGAWTLELVAVHPCRVHAGMPICQVAFAELVGERQPYKGRYQYDTGPVASRLYLDHTNGEAK